MKRLKIALAAVLLAVISVTVIPAGKKDNTFSGWAEGDKAYSRVWFGPAHASMKRFNQVGFPKRVGLISFYLFDSGTHKFSAMAATYGGTYFESFGLNERGANEFASEFAKLGVPVLKKRFAEHGMELVTPVEFLNTDEQKQAYIDFELPKSGWNKFASSVAGWLDRNPHADGAADGYEMIATHLWTDRGILNALDELRVALGLDGLAVMTNITTSNTENVIYRSAVLDIYGPNPDPKPEKYAKYWTPTILYTRGTFGKGFKGLPFAYWKKENIERTEYEGYDGFIDAITRRTLDELHAKLDKGK